MDNFGLTKKPFRRPRRYEFIDGLNVKIRLTDKKLWPSGVQIAVFYQCPRMSSVLPESDPRLYINLVFLSK